MRWKIRTSIILSYSFRQPSFAILRTRRTIAPIFRPLAVKRWFQKLLQDEFTFYLPFMTLLDGGTRDAEPHQIVPHSFPRFLYEMAFHITIERSQLELVCFKLI
jgi:hypothetical protein